MQLVKILQSQGFGSRKQCTDLIKNGHVHVEDQACLNPKQDFSTENFQFQVNGKLYNYTERLLIALHKPAGYECSRQPAYHASVHSLLPSRFNNRGIQAAGRLDQDTAGLLLLTDDGQLLHQLTHPKQHLPKFYRAWLARPLTAEQTELLTTTGVALHQEQGRFTFNSLQPVSEGICDVVLTQGLYHQVKRMFAAAGNHVEKLERTGIGQLTLESLALEEGRWKEVTTDSVFDSGSFQNATTS